MSLTAYTCRQKPTQTHVREHIHTSTHTHTRPHGPINHFFPRLFSSAARLLLLHHVNFNPAKRIGHPNCKDHSGPPRINKRKGKFFEVASRPVKDCFDFPAQSPSRAADRRLERHSPAEFYPYGARAEGSESRARATGTGEPSRIKSKKMEKKSLLLKGFTAVFPSQ